jgi:hypothetical protein
VSSDSMVFTLAYAVYAAVLVVAVGIIVLAWLTSRWTTVPGGGPVGFGGWLFLLAVRQTLGLIGTFAGLAWYARTYLQVFESPVPNAQLAGYLTGAMVLASLLIEVVVTIAMYAKHRSFPDMFVIQWIMVMAVFLLGVGMIWLLFHLPVDLIVRVENGPAFLAAAVVESLWVLYLARSKRVRNTFVK